jgi:hypothetical protein
VDPHEVLKRIVSKLAPGRPPAYSEAHALKALEVIGAGNGIGRKGLSRVLGLGEGTVRTLVSRFKEEALIEVSHAGMTLTSSGVNILSHFRGLMKATPIPETSITVSSKDYAILVKGAGDQINQGLEQRDEALLAGADGATTLLCDGERLWMPGMEVDLDPSTTVFLLERLKPESGDVIIIGTSDNPILAEVGAKSAALKLIKGMTPFISH